jgi:hypothetical protein
MMKLNKYLLVFTSFFLLSGCTSKASLQSYFVDHEGASAFVSYDIPMSILNTENILLSEDQSDAINSIDKLNTIAYNLASGSLEELESELINVKNIFKTSHYKELMRMGLNSDRKVKIMYLENDGEVNEIIVFGYSVEMGFAIVRVLGDNMELSKILKLGEVIDQFGTENTNIDNVMKYLL